MLVLSRRVQESIVISGDIVITVVRLQGNQVRLGISAPSEMSVHRGEVHELIQQEKRTRPPGTTPN